MKKEDKKSINLQILDKAMSFVTTEKEEAKVRHAANIVNERAIEIKKAYPTLDTPTILAYVAIEKQMEESGKEDYLSTHRNGHRLNDMYDPKTNTLDIRSNGLYPSNVLSNMCSNGFRFDGMLCGSMEGFLQSLKRKETDKQRQICSMKGGNARKMSVTSWQTDQIVWWKGKAIDRQGEEYQQLLRDAYLAMFEQSERFRTALMMTRGMTLTHSCGETSPYKTILTPDEYCNILTELRDNYDKRDKREELIEKSV